MIPEIEQQYRNILSNIEELYYEVDLSGNLTFFNDSMTRILGYSKEELMGMNNQKYMSGETAKRVYETFNQVYRTGIPTKAFDWELIRKDGTIRVLETSVSLMHDSEGRPIGFYGIGRDITERKRTENALRESEKRYRALFEGSKDAIYITTPEGEIIDANQSMLDLFGYCREEIIGLNVRKTYVYPEDRRKFKQQIEREGFVRDYEIKLCKRDGTEMECLVTATVRRADDGGILGYQGIIRDVTERNQILNELRTEKQRFQALSENAPFGMVMIDQDGGFRYINPKFRELFGYNLTEVPNGRTWFRKAYPDSFYRHDVISAWKEDLKSFKPGEKRSRVFSVTCKDGTGKIINFIPVQLATDENLMACEDITEQKRAEEALRESEEKYRTILNSIEDFYYEVDLTGNMTFFNDPMVKLSGFSEEELIGLNYRKYVSEETAKKVYQTFNQVYQTGVPAKGFDWEVIRKDGTKRFFEASVSLKHDPKGQPVGFFGTGRDITERKQAEEALRQSEEKYRTILNSVEEGYYEVDLAGNFTFSNDFLAKSLGYTREELEGLNNRQYMSPETAKLVFNTFNEVYRTGNPKRDFEWELINKDGTKRFVEVSVSLMRDRKGVPKGFYGTARDITERKKEEEALKEWERKYRMTLQNLDVEYFEVDLNGNFTFFTDIFCRILGYSKEELMGMNNRQYQSEDTAKKIYQVYNQVYRTGKPVKDIELEVICKDGSKRFVETSCLLQDSGGQPIGFCGFVRDVTERKQAEERERDLQRAKDKVLNHLSHELRTPVSVIQGNIRVLKRKIQRQTPPIVGEETFDLLERNVGRLSHIQLEADEIIRFYREMEKNPHLKALDILPSGGVERISLYSFVQKVLGVVKEEASHRDIRITLEGASDLTLNANPEILKGMFIGLLKNSIENTPDEGVIRIGLEQKAQWIQVKFMDFGIGVTKVNQRRLFDGLFHTLDTELYGSKNPYDFGAGGKGLDLLRMKIYSQRFGFDISVESQRCLYLPTDRDLCPGRISKCPHCRAREDCFSSGGSTFCLTFPVTGGNTLSIRHPY